MTGIPFETRLHCGTEEAVLYGVTGQKLRLPIGSDDPDARVTVGITELLSGLSVEVVLQHGSEPAAAPTELSRCTPSRQADAIRGFARRKSRALVVALTPAQAAQPEGRVLGDKLVAFYQAQGRRARLGGAEPGDVVLQPQPFEHVSRYPRWQTEDCDVVLLGTARDNLLIYDQARANLLPWQSSDLPAGEVRLSYTWSPFVGEYDAVNVLARDLDGLRRGVELLTTLH